MNATKRALRHTGSAALVLTLGLAFVSLTALMLVVYGYYWFASVVVDLMAGE